MAKGNNGDDTKNKSNKKRSRPQPGDADYKSPTQLRNARKRRKQKQDKSSLSSSKSPAASDPSLKYISKPKHAPKVKAAIEFFHNHWEKTKEGNSKFPVLLGPTKGWRTVARLAVRQVNDSLRIGLFVPGSHDLLEVPQCQAHHPRINEAVEVLQKQCKKCNIQAFDDKDGKGNLRHVALAVERSTGRQQLTLIWKETNKASTRQLNELCKALQSVSEDKSCKGLELQSLWVHFNNSWKHANSIVDRTGRWEQKYGKEPSMVEHLETNSNLKVPLYFPPQVFRQANLDAFTKIVVRIREWLEEQSTKKKGLGTIQHALELYGGVGTIGLNCIDLVNGTFVSSDENPFNQECFDRSADHLEIKGNDRDDESKETRRKNIQYIPENATAMTQRQNLWKQANVLIVDPPRKGLDQEVIDMLCRKNFGPRRQGLIYVSCGFDAFCRDFEALHQAGWKLDHAEGHILFPGSDAIETLAFLVRKNKKE
eukprot:Nitzschia sp. Nitz4//scaffold154_size52827//25428//26873//NITZ4_006777-RA/size52827-processed-gene-0.74-mRNA-1//1//CDS//3329537311//9035//frame0